MPVRPLHYAALFNDNPGMVQALVDAGADPNARDGDGDTPLQLAMMFNDNPEVAQALVDAGAET